MRKQQCLQLNGSKPVAVNGRIAASALDPLRDLIQGREWVKGAVNYDEDLHFSTYYLRASCVPHTGRLYPGYTCLVALYEGFNEHYYLLKDECRQTAVAIVKKALKRPEWLPSIVQEIVRLSDRLTRLFDLRTSPARLARMSAAQLRRALRPTRSLATHPVPLRSTSRSARPRRVILFQLPHGTFARARAVRDGGGRDVCRPVATALA